MTMKQKPTMTNAPSALAVFESEGAWVVGGAVRDTLAGEAPAHCDIDLAMADAAARARRAGDVLGAPAAKISSHFEIWRIVLADGQIDIWDLPDADIARDLRRRDFTVNAMAVPLGDFRRGDLSTSLLDPFRGRDDVASRNLRLVSDGAFRDDPLRMLRAVRLEAERQWRPDSALRLAMRRDASRLNQSAAERQWDELRRILLSDRLPWGLRRLEQSGLLSRLFPELDECRDVAQRPVHRRDVFWHQIDAVRWIVRLTAHEPPRGAQASALWRALGPWAYPPARSSRSSTSSATIANVTTDVRASLDRWRLPLRLATLLHDIGKPATRTVDGGGSTHFYGHSELGAEMARARLNAMRVPTKTVSQVELLINHHLRPGQVNSPGRAPTARALHRFHSALGEAAAPLCWLFLADSLATAGPKSLLPRWSTYVAHVGRILRWRPKLDPKSKRLLDGHTIMQIAGLEPGPLVGEIKAQIDEAAALGDVTSRDDAVGMVRRLARDRAIADESRSVAI